MNTRAPHTQRPTSSITRTLTRTALAFLTAALFAAAIVFTDIGFVTAALLAGLAGIAVDLRQTSNLVRATVAP